MASPAAVVDDARRLYRKRYGHNADIAVQAPGRVNLIGEHIDYNDGLVLPMAIERCIALVAGRRDDGPDGMRVFSAALDQEIVIDYATIHKRPVSGWAAYVVGVVALCQKAGMKPPAMDVMLVSDLPRGAGLSSSAALEVATATLLETVCNAPIDAWDKVRLCQQAEHDYAGMPCGIMDQATVVLAKEQQLLLIDCESLQIRHVPFDDPSVSMLITNSQVKHKLTDSPFARRRQQCVDAAAAIGKPLHILSLQELDARRCELDEVAFRRARHVVTEINRTTRAAQAIAARSWQLAGELMYASHASLRDDYEVSCAEVDALVDICAELGLNAGVYGSRMTGGGFGGCSVTLVDTDSVQTIQAAIADAYQFKTGLQAEFISSRPAAGARVVDT